MPTSFPGTLSVRIELWSGLDFNDGPSCGFTIDHSFRFPPMKEDGVIFTCGEGEPHVAEVTRCLHYDGLKSETLVLTKPYICKDYEELLRILDWFKARYEIHNLSASESPEPYYVMYRTLIDLLEIKEDSPHIPYDQRSLKIVCETIRTIYIVECSLRGIGPDSSYEGIKKAISASTDMVMRLMQDILVQKNTYKDSIPLIRIAQLWDEIANDHKNWTWDVAREQCVLVGKVVFENINTDDVPFLAQA